MKSAAILDLLFYRLTQCGAITGTGNGYSAIFYHSTRLCNRFMEAAILEQQEQQEKVDYKESFPTTGNVTFSCSTQVSRKFIILINVKMPTIVGILTLISMINTSSESLKTSSVCLYFQHFSFHEQLNSAQLS